jgi:GAF domain-containing protein
MTVPDATLVDQVHEGPQLGFLRRTWERVTGPATSVDSSEGQRQARILSSFTLALTLLVAIGIVSVLFSNPVLDAALITQITLAVICAVAYVISRSRHYPWAAVLTVGTIGALPFGLYITTGDYSDLNTIRALLWSLISLLLGNIFFRVRGVVISVGVMMLALVGLTVVIPEVTFQKVFFVLTFAFITGLLSLVSLRYRTQLEASRQAELTDKNRELQSLSAFLESRVADRTQDLALAAEVGHAISQVRELDELLTDAAELVRVGFDLYYVQIYLTDASESNLVLHVGTGAAGKELISRGHRLLFGPGSINGLAASDKKAVVVPDTTASPIFHPNPLLPETRSEIAIPLLVGERVVGVLDLQSAQAGALTRGSLPPFKTFASQLAIAIDNVSLYAQVETAHAEFQARAAKQTAQDWREFLDGIHRQEWSGYVYDRETAVPLEMPLSEFSNELTLNAPISLAGQSLGQIRLRQKTGTALTEADNELLQSIASQVAQKVENLRLLSEAEQYRHEAEQAARRLVRKGWQEYLDATKAETTGYLYDQHGVRLVDSGDNGDWRPELSRSLTIGDETFGQLDIGEISGDKGEAAQLLAAVAQQLGSHIENLRLSEQTEQALSATEEQAGRLAMLNRMSEALNRAPTAEDIYEIAVRHIGEILVSDQVSLVMMSTEGDGVNLVATLGEQEYIVAGSEVLLAQRPALERAIRENRVIIAPFAEDSPYGDVRSRIISPLMGDRKVVGAIIAGSVHAQAYSGRDGNLLQQIAAILGATLESHLLAEQAQQRAKRERILRRITARVHTAVDAQSILRTAAQEVNRALGLETFAYLDDVEEGEPANGQRTAHES